MPKLNFNVPFLTETGEPVTQIRSDKKKLKIDERTGQGTPEVCRDEQGNAIQDDVLIKDMLARILNAGFEGDDKVSFSDKAKRGKLARKIVSSSTANYRTEELNIIQELSAKAASTALITQIDEIINGKDEEPGEVIPSESSAKS